MAFHRRWPCRSNPTHASRRDSMRSMRGWCPYFIGGILIVLIPAAPATPQPTGSAKTLDVKIDLTQASGLDAAKVLRPGLTAYGSDTIPGPVWDKTLSAQRVGYAVIEPECQIILPSTSRDDMQARIDIQLQRVMDVV